MWISGSVRCFPTFLFIFLPKFAEIVKICFFSSVKFIRSSCFRKRLHSLWKTHEKPSFFPQKILICRPGSILPGRRKTGSQQSLPAGNFRWKRHWKTKNFCVSEKYTQICEKNGAFSNNIHPFFRAGITNSAELSKNCPQNQSTILSAEKTVKLKKYVFFRKI